MRKRNLTFLSLLFFFVTGTHNTYIEAIQFAIRPINYEFEQAVECIKEHEGWHTERNFPYIGYGHKILSHETLDYQTITEEQATALVRQDLQDRCAYFRAFGQDSLLLAVLAYNVGVYNLIGYQGNSESRLIQKLRNGDRDIYNEYISFRKANGRVLKSLEKRRINEFNLLYKTEL